MVISDDLQRTLCTGSAVRINQGLRINLEMGFRSDVDIGGGNGRDDAVISAKQDTAGLARVLIPGRRDQRGKNSACQHNVHAPMP